MAGTDWVLFGDGHVALYYDEKPVTPDREGILNRPLLVAPEEDIVEKYNLQEEDLPIKTDDNKKACWMDYNDNYIIPLKQSRNGSVFLILCAYDGSKTKLTNFYREILDRLDEKNKELFQLKGHISMLNERCNNLGSNIVESIRKDKEIIDAIKEESSSDDEDGG